MNDLAEEETLYTGVSTRRRSVIQVLAQHNSVVILAVLIIASSLLSSEFMSIGNISNLLRQLMPLLLTSIGMLIVINTAGIDLSVGSIAGFGGLIVAMCIPIMPLGGGVALLLGTIVALAAGGALGAVNGALVALFDLAPFIVTLAMMTVARGLTFMLSNGQPIQLPDDAAATVMMDAFGSNDVPFTGLPWPVLLGVIVIAGFYFLMSHMTFGRMIVATGSNETAVRLAGIPEKRYKFFVYVISGALAALAGIVLTSRTDVGTPIAGTGLELDAIAACVIGGALLSGGRGTVLNTVIGVLVLGLIGNIMNLLSVPAYPQQIIKGIIIIIAVLLQRVSRERAP